MRKPFVVLVAAALVSVAAAASPAQAQGWLDRAKQKAKERVDRATDQATDKALDRGEAVVKCAASDAACIDAAKKAGKQVQVEGAADAGASANGAENGAASATAGAPAGASAAGSLNVGRDFTAGTRVIYATDFSRDELGDFPRAFELKSGNFEVASIGSTRYLRGTSFGSFEIPLPEVLPEMFTLEFDLKPVSGWAQHVYFTAEGDDRPYLIFYADNGGIEGPRNYRVRTAYRNPDPKNHVVRVQVMADGKYVKVYMNGTRVANAPNADIGRSNKLTFNISASDDYPVLIGNVRVAAGGKDLYKALAETGRVTAEGIFFDTNADRIRPESEPALRQIGDMLKSHPEMKLGIEGHTDNVGGAAANQTLSDKRAAAVRAYLVTNYGVAGDRLTAKGLGATKPAASNDTEDGRQKNRRVELVRM